jgi:membrane-associated protein
MEIIESLIDIFLNLDKHLLNVVNNYRYWTYLILFLIIYCETGFVVTPFLPGDSLLFAAGAIAATGALNIWIVILLLCIAAILGDSTNYGIGKYFGQKAFESKYRFFKKEYLIKTQAFYERHGGKTILIARFIPIIRTFAPFIAGIGRMHYGTFIFYNIAGGIFWVTVCSIGGYFFGNIPIVKDNFSIVVLAIIVISILPMALEYLKYQYRKVRE